MKLRNFIRISGFALLIIGTVGLLLNGFAWGGGTTRAIIFGVAGLVGLVNLAFAQFGMKG